MSESGSSSVGGPASILQAVDVTELAFTVDFNPLGLSPKMVMLMGSGSVKDNLCAGTMTLWGLGAGCVYMCSHFTQNTHTHTHKVV